MDKGRLEAFTDGVIAIIITIMVLEVKVPQGADFAALQSGLPVCLAYVLSYVNVGIFWNNHHHMLQATERVDGKVLWANMSSKSQRIGVSRAAARSKFGSSNRSAIDGAVTASVWLQPVSA
jgi:hypothetical protein